MRLPSLNEFIPAIAIAIDEQFGKRQRLVENKRIKYFHEDPTFRQALEEASWELNPTGMQVFFDKIELYEKRRDCTELMEDGRVMEKYSTVDGLYDVDGNKCSCSAFGQHFYCRHIIFFRVQRRLQIFQLSSFHPSLHKSSDGKSPLKEAENRRINPDSPPSPGLKVVKEALFKRKPPTQAKKYNTAFDVVKEIAEILALYEEKRFDIGLEASKNFIRLLRSGLPDTLVKFLKSPTMYTLVSSNKMQPIVIEDDDDEPTSTQERDVRGISSSLSQSYNLSQGATSSQPLQGVDQSAENTGVGVGRIDPGHTAPRGYQAQESVVQLAHGYREIPERHRRYFTPDCVVKTIRGTGGCAYAAVCHKLLSDQDQFRLFREACHNFLIRVWNMMQIARFMVFPFPITVISDDADQVKVIQIESENQYLDFLKKPESLTSFSESNIEIQNMSNVLNVDIHVFTYSQTECYTQVFKPMPHITSWSEWAFPSNDGLNTVVLYHQEHTHFETIVSRSEAILPAQRQSTLKRKKFSEAFDEWPELPDVFESSFDEINLSPD